MIYLSNTVQNLSTVMMHIQCHLNQHASATPQIWPFSLGKLWSSMSPSCSPEFKSCDALHSSALVSCGSLQLGNQSCLPCYIFFMPGIFQTVTKILLFSRFSSAVAEKTFSESVEQVRDHNKLSVPHYNTFAWLTKPPNTLLDIVIEVLIVSIGYVAEKGSVLILYITFTFL